jgi:hypothetical protein
MFILLVGPLVLGSYLLAQGIGSGSSGGGFSSSSGSFALPAGVVQPQSITPPLLMALSPGMAIGAEVASISSQNCTSVVSPPFGGPFNASPTYYCGGVSFDRISSGPLNGWHIWQVFAVFAVALSALCVGLAIVALRRNVPWPRRAPPEGT